MMDDLQCAGKVVSQTLHELDVINRWLGGNKVTLDGIHKLLTRHSQPKGKTIAIADLGCGGGDMLKMIARWARQNHYSVQLTGIDANQNIVEYARNNCKDFDNIRIEKADILSAGFSGRTFDIITCTLFLHHFSDQQLAELFQKLNAQSNLGIVVNDLHRHWLAFHSIKLLTQLFSQSSMVKNDAPLSVARAFRKQELEHLLKLAQIDHYELRWHWAFRWQLIVDGMIK